MKIKQITNQHRNDFCAILECEHCQHEAQLTTGYHDDFYHRAVVPSMLCGRCGLNRAGTTEPVDGFGHIDVETTK